MSQDADYKIELEVFEGPLDLLLHLVKKHELSILDIPVSFITEKYLEYLELMRQLNLDIAGEYLFMAATLVHLKSRELLPTPDPTQADEIGEDGEPEEDPRQELIRRLLEYQKYKQAAGQLGERPVIGRNVWTRGAPVDDLVDGGGREGAPLAEIPVFKLVEALAELMARARVRISHEVIVDRLSITDRINQLVDRLDAEGTFSFASCFAFLDDDHEVGAAQVKHEVVVTFLAILEMTRLKLIRISQPGDQADIHITRAVEDVKDRAKQGIPGEGDYR
jgi:segregation and condensation protein A